MKLNTKKRKKAKDHLDQLIKDKEARPAPGTVLSEELNQMIRKHHELIAKERLRAAGVRMDIEKRCSYCGFSFNSLSGVKWQSGASVEYYCSEAHKDLVRPVLPGSISMAPLPTTAPAPAPTFTLHTCQVFCAEQLHMYTNKNGFTYCYKQEEHLLDALCQGCERPEASQHDDTPVCGVPHQRITKFDGETVLYDWSAPPVTITAGDTYAWTAPTTPLISCVESHSDATSVRWSA